MKFYSSEIVDKIKTDRKKGYSVTYLSKLYNIPDTTISRWVKEIKTDFNSFNSAKARNNEQKEKLKEIVKTYNITKNNARLLCSLLYWCEGSKYPSSNFIGFSNSDYRLIKTFLKLFRQGFNIDENKLRIHLQIHSNQDFNKLLIFWSKLLKIPKTQFYKPTITNPTKNMKRTKYKGTCTIKYFDLKLLQQISGLFEAFGEIA